MKHHHDKGAVDEAHALALAVESSSQMLREAWENLRATPSLQPTHLKDSISHIAVNATRQVRVDLREQAHDAVVDHAVAIVAGAFAVGVLIGLSR
jgi:hypothetical protein